VDICRPTPTISFERMDRSTLSLRWMDGHSFCKPSKIIPMSYLRTITGLNSYRKDWSQG
jgi:hypothetical protein